MWATLLAALASFLTGFVRMWREPTATGEAEKAGAAMAGAQADDHAIDAVAAAQEARTRSEAAGPAADPAGVQSLPDDGFRRD